MNDDDANSAADRRARVRGMILRQRVDPVHQAMMARIVERSHRLRAKLKGVDVVTLSDADWQEWLSVHNIFERDKARGRRQNHRHALKMAARAAALQASGEDDLKES